MSWLTYTLDLPGPEFLILFISLTVGVLILAAFARFVYPRTFSTPAAEDLDLYELAFLAGGEKRVLQTAVHELKAAGHVELEDSHLVTKPIDRSALHPVESDVLDAATLNPSAKELHSAVTAPARDLTRGLKDKGYFLSGASLNKVRSAILLPLVPWLGLGVAKALVGVERGRPILFLLLLIAAGLITTLCFLIGEIRSGKATRLLSGLRSGRLDDAYLGAALPIALVGLGADDELRKHFFAPAAAGGSGCGAMGCGGGGGCSGGGCGGGCGGCGGCGG